MRSASNLAWPHTPFGAGQRPFGRSRPMLAAVAVDDPPGGDADAVPRWACVIYLRVTATRTVCVDGAYLNFGFEALVPVNDHPDEAAALRTRVDQILIAARRQATVLAGHHLLAGLERLSTDEDAQRGIDAIRARWAERTQRERGTARLIDLAEHRAGERASEGAASGASLAALCAGAALRSDTLRSDPPRTDAPPAPGDTARCVPVRAAITHTLAVALLAARQTRHLSWSMPIDLDDLVTTAAWDQLS